MLLSEQSHDFTARPLVANNSALILGQYINSSNANFDGTLDEVYIYDRLLTDYEINTLMDEGSDGDPLLGTSTGNLLISVIIGIVAILILVLGIFLWLRARRKASIFM